jgi:hypothetical protein
MNWKRRLPIENNADTPNMLLTSKVIKRDPKIILPLTLSCLSLNHWYLVASVAALQVGDNYHFSFFRIRYLWIRFYTGSFFRILFFWIPLIWLGFICLWCSGLGFFRIPFPPTSFFSGFCWPDSFFSGFDVIQKQSQGPGTYFRFGKTCVVVEYGLPNCILLLL